jgi:uncharacterized membrane protein
VVLSVIAHKKCTIKIKKREVTAKMKPLNIVGLVILFAGAIILVGFGLYRLVDTFLSDSTLPAIVKWGITGVILGVIIILISLIVERIRDRKEERQKP